MSIFTGPMRQHLDGHKELTEHVAVATLATPEKVYIPLAVMNSANYELAVEAGAKVKVGTKIALIKGSFWNIPLFSSVSGTVAGVEKVMTTALKPGDHLVIESDGLQEEEAPLQPIDPKSASREELINFMHEAGIVGCGGAGFPTYCKYPVDKAYEHILINGVECEPYLTSDANMMELFTKELIVGTAAMVKMAQTKDAVIAIKETHPELIKKVQDEIAASGESNITVHVCPDVFPMGWERTVTYEIFKKRYDRLPGEVGVIVDNASTAISFAQAMLTGMPITKKLVTVSGDAVKEPKNVWAPVGTKAKALTAAAGGYSAEDVICLAGGPMMGKAVTSDEWCINSYNNAITVLETKPVVQDACLRCGACTEHCPAGLQPCRIRQAEKTGDVDGMKAQDIMKCIECGLCSAVCPSHLDVTESIRRGKRRMALIK